MQDLLPLAERIGARLKQRGETIAVAESSTGGLISAALLSVPGASAYFLGGGVIYTKLSRHLLLGLTDEDVAAIKAEKPLTEPVAARMAEAFRARFSANWALAEIGATGPTGTSYGDAPGTSCIAVAGPSVRTIRIETGQADRVGNMREFSKRALELLSQAIA